MDDFFKLVSYIALPVVVLLVLWIVVQRSQRSELEPHTVEWTTREEVVMPKELTHISNEETDMKISEMEQQLPTQPTSFAPLARLAHAYVSSGKTENLVKALGLLKKWEGVYSSEPRLHTLYAAIYVQMEGERELAIIHAKRSVELAPDNPRPRNALGYVLWRYGDLDEAIEVTQQAIALAAASPDKYAEDLAVAQGNLAYYYAQVGKNEEDARRYVLQAYEYFKDPGTLDTLGYVEMRFATSDKELHEARDILVKAKNAGARSALVDRHLEEVNSLLSSQTAESSGTRT